MALESLEELPHYNGWVYGTLWGLCILIAYLVRKDPEAAVPYTVDAPEQIEPGWKGEEVEQTTLKVLYRPSVCPTSTCHLSYGQSLITCICISTCP